MSHYSWCKYWRALDQEIRTLPTCFIGRGWGHSGPMTWWSASDNQKYAEMHIFLLL